MDGVIPANASAPGQAYTVSTAVRYHSMCSPRLVTQIHRMCNC